MENNVLTFQTTDYSLASFLAAKKIAGIGKIAWLNKDDRSATVEIFYSEVNSITFNRLLQAYASKQEVTLNLQKYSDNFRFIASLAKQKRGLL